MSKVKANLIKINLKSGNYELACYIALLNNMEGCTTTRKDGSITKSVYLPNAYEEVNHVLSKHQWAGYLSVLAAKEQYACYDPDGYFGDVICKQN